MAFFALASTEGVRGGKERDQEGSVFTETAAPLSVALLPTLIGLKGAPRTRSRLSMKLPVCDSPGPETGSGPPFSVRREGTKSRNNRNSLITWYLLYHFALIRLLFQSCRWPDNYTGSYIWMTYTPQRYASAIKIITVQFCHSILYKWQKRSALWKSTFNAFW